MTALYQLTIAAMLLGTVQATGHDVSPLALLGAFGATQFAGAVPGPNGASPREGALVVALVALGVPWASAMAAVALKAALVLASGTGTRRRQPGGDPAPARQDERHSTPLPA